MARHTIRLPDNRGTVTIEVQTKNDKTCLSIVGNLYAPNRPHTDRWQTNGGQIYDTLLREWPHHEGIRRLVSLWKRWHLNDARAGCAHQRALGWDKEPIDPTQPLNKYGLFPPNNTPSWNMKSWVPSSLGGYLSRPCPECGYKYGTAWLHEDLPPEVVTELMNIRLENT